MVNYGFKRGVGVGLISNFKHLMLHVKHSFALLSIPEMVESLCF